MSQLTEKKENILDVYIKELSGEGLMLDKLLPASISKEKFIAVVRTILTSNAEFLNCDKRSLFNACKQSAQDGLLPDGKDACFIVFNSQINNQWVPVVQYLPMVRGVIRKLEPVLKDLTVAIVYENDLFDYELGDEPRLRHRPTLKSRGEKLGCYCIMRTKEGGIYRDYMSKEDIEDLIRKVKGEKTSKIWKNWPDEMWKKTVIRRLAKRVPLPIDCDSVVTADNAIYDISDFEEVQEETHIDKLNKMLSEVPPPAPTYEAPAPEEAFI